MTDQDMDPLDRIFWLAQTMAKLHLGLLHRKEADQLRCWLERSPDSKKKLDALFQEGALEGRIKTFNTFEADTATEFARVAQLAGINGSYQERRRCKDIIRTLPLAH